MGEPEAAEEGGRQRLILHNFLSLQECKELEFIHKSNRTDVGYRPNVFSTTLAHHIATKFNQKMFVRRML